MALKAVRKLIQALKRAGNVNTVVSWVSIVVYFSISIFMLWESRKTLQLGKRLIARKPRGEGEIKDVTRHSGQSRKGFNKSEFGQWLSLPTSGIPEISLWIILLVSFVGGFFSGFLGGGAGYIRMPSMVYVLGIPTHLAVGTDLFEIIISASYGTFTHAIKGNVDILIALVMHTGAVIGAQIGVVATQYFAGPKIRLAFVPLPLIGAAIVLYTL